MEIFEIRKHRVSHCDLMQFEFATIMKGEKAQIMYSDPPWGEGNLRYWQTMNKKMTGANSNEVDLVEFLKRIFHIAATYVDGIVFIEYGQAWSDQIIKMGQNYGLTHEAKVELLYRSGSKLRPLDLHVFSTKGRSAIITKEWLQSVYQTYGYDTLKKAIGPHAKEGMIIIDPCCGMGYTAQIAIDYNMAFRGNELNRKRLQKTIDRLSK